MRWHGCLLTNSGAHLGRESPDPFPLELSQILRGRPEGWDNDDPLHWEHTTKVSPARESSGRNPGLDCNVHGYRRKAGGERSEWLSLARAVGLRLGLEFRGAWAWDSGWSWILQSLRG